MRETQGLQSHAQLIDQLEQRFQIHAKTGESLAAWMGGTFHSHQVTHLIGEILKTPALLASIASQSYQHANGFLKVVIGNQSHWKLRLHIWFPGTPCEESIHNHRWGLASTILCGQLHSETYMDDANGPVTGDEYRYYARTPSEPSYKTTVGRCRLRRLKHSQRGAGEHYFLPAHTLHRICTPVQGDLVATMMCSTPTTERCNRLLVTDDHRHINPNTDQHMLTPSELAQQLRRFLQHYAPLAQ